MKQARKHKFGKGSRKNSKYHADDNATPSPRALLSYAPKRKLDLQHSSGKAGISYPDSLSGRGIIVPENPA